MNKTISKQRGFAVVETVLILIIIGMLVGIGWYVYDTNHKTNATLDSTNKTLNQSPATKTKSSKFVFKELGVEFTVPDEIKDLSYTAQSINPVSGGEEDTALYLSSKSFKASVEKCYNQKADNISFGAISKTSGQYPDNPDPSNTDGALLKQFDTFYISGSFPNGLTTCAPGVDDQLVFSQAHKFWGSFTDAFKNTAEIAQ